MVHKVYPFSLATKKLKFEKGETVKVIEKPENDQERWKCKNAWGQAGLVPPTTWWCSTMAYPVHVACPIHQLPGVGAAGALHRQRVVLWQ